MNDIPMAMFNSCFEKFGIPFELHLSQTFGVALNITK